MEGDFLNNSTNSFQRIFHETNNIKLLNATQEIR